jgi:hypothetical protein
MARFLLPVFPLALAASFAALAALYESRWKLSQVFSLVTAGLTLVMGAGGFLLYDRDALACSLGRISQEQYLQRHAPDYERIDFVNQTLAGEGGNEKALVFFRHVYYLNVPFVYGDPAASWGIDPEKLQTSEAWLTFFRQQHIRWVVRSQEYPEPIAGPLRQLENSGNLIPQAQAETMDFTGKRMEGVKRSTSTVILRVQDHL